MALAKMMRDMVRCRLLESTPGICCFVIYDMMFSIVNILTETLVARATVESVCVWVTAAVLLPPVLGGGSWQQAGHLGEDVDVFGSTQRPHHHHLVTGP